MEQIPAWIWPIATLLSGGFGGWVGVKVAVTKLEVQMTRALEDIARHERILGQHNDDLLTHDMELETALTTLKLKRVRRQPLRGWET